LGKGDQDFSFLSLSRARGEIKAPFSPVPKQKGKRLSTTTNTILEINAGPVVIPGANKT